MLGKISSQRFSCNKKFASSAYQVITLRTEVVPIGNSKVSLVETDINGSGGYFRDRIGIVLLDDASRNRVSERLVDEFDGCHGGMTAKVLGNLVDSIKCQLDVVAIWPINSPCVARVVVAILRSRSYHYISSIVNPKVKFEDSHLRADQS